MSKRWRLEFMVKREGMDHWILKDVRADNREDAIRIAREKWNEMFKKPPHMFHIKAEQRSEYGTFYHLFMKKYSMLPVIDNEW